MKITTPDGIEREMDERPYIMVGFSGATPMPFTLGTTGNLQTTAGGITNIVRAAFNRPTDTTPYAAGDAVSNSTSAPTILTLADVARVNGGTGIITDLRLSTNNPATTNASFKVILFNDVIAAVNDNAAYPQLWANDAKRIASFDLTLQTGGAGSDAASATLEQIGRTFKCAPATRNLYAVIVANAAYTPASGQTFAVTLGTAND